MVRWPTSPNSPFIATCWLALARKWPLSRNKANRSTKLLQQSLLRPQTQSGATGSGVLKILSEMFFRACEVLRARQLHFVKEAHMAGQEKTLHIDVPTGVAIDHLFPPYTKEKSTSTRSMVQLLD